MITEYHQKDKTTATIKIVVEESDYQKEVEAAIKKYARNAQIKGFRPGHAPIGLIKKMHGKAFVQEEVHKISSDFMLKFLENEKIHYVGMPLIDEQLTPKYTFNEKAFEFFYKIGFASGLDIDYNTLNLIDYEIEISDENFEKHIETLYKRFSKSIEPETIEKGDIAFGVIRALNEEQQTLLSTLMSKIEEDEENEEEDKAALNEDKVEVDEEGKAITIDEKDEKGFFVAVPTERLSEEALNLFLGQDNQSTIQFDIQKAFANPEDLKYFFGTNLEEIQGIQGTYEIKLERISRLATPEKTPDFFNEILGIPANTGSELDTENTTEAVTTEEEFRARIKELLYRNYRQEGISNLKMQIQEAIAYADSIEMPKEFLSEYFSKMNPEKREGISIEEIERFIPELRWSLFSKKIFKELDTLVEKEEILQTATNEIAQRYRRFGLQEEYLKSPEIYKMVVAEAQRELFAKTEEGDNFREYIMQKVQDDKVLNHLITIVNPQKQIILLEDYNQMNKK